MSVDDNLWSRRAVGALTKARHQNRGALTANLPQTRGGTDALQEALEELGAVPAGDVLAAVVAHTLDAANQHTVSDAHNDAAEAKTAFIRHELLQGINEVIAEGTVPLLGDGVGRRYEFPAGSQRHPNLQQRPS